MDNYWENKFKNEGALWKFEPSDSALHALELFKKNQIRKILIPGIGYGRNAKPFYDEGFDITGIEISASAIKLANENGMHFPIYHGSITQMPFNNDIYEGIFCYALLHLFNKKVRNSFLNNCILQLKAGGLMVFTVVSDKSDMYGKGKYISTNRFKINTDLCVYFYNNENIEKEFGPFGLIDYFDIAEPIKFAEGYEPILCKYVICRNTIAR